ncbi:hypothetical protein BDN70DRAFT_902395, partial [Pholiota conissans]
PRGRETLHLQQPSDDEIENIAPKRRSGHPTHSTNTFSEADDSFSSQATTHIGTPPRRVKDGKKKTGPQLSTQYEKAVEKARLKIQKVGPKRSWEDHLLDISTKNMEWMAKRDMQEQREKKRMRHLKELELNVISKAEYIEQLAKLRTPSPVPPVSSFSGPRPISPALPSKPHPRPPPSHAPSPPPPVPSSPGLSYTSGSPQRQFSPHDFASLEWDFDPTIHN